MEVVVLVGGKGTRMRPLTYSRPKPLLPLLNQPILQHILDRLPGDVTKLVLPVNYLKEQIEAYFEEHPDPRVVLVDEKEPLGTGGAIKNCESHLTGTFYVYNGDIVTSLRLEDLYATHKAKKAEATISLWPVQEPWHFGVVKLASDGRIERFVEKPTKGSEPSNLINAGHYVLERRTLEKIPAGRMFSIEKELYTPMAAAGGRLYGHPFQGYWIDCGRPEALLEAHATVLGAQGKAVVVHKEADVSPKARVAGYAIDRGCHVGAGATIERSVLMPDVHVGAKAVLRDCIVGEGAEVEDGVTLERVVVGDYGIVETGRTIKDQRIGMRPIDLEA